MHIPTAYIALTALVLHFTLGIGHGACAEPPGDCQHAHVDHAQDGHHHDAESQPASGESRPDGRTCDGTNCSVVLTAKTSLAELSQNEILPLAILSVLGPCELPALMQWHRQAINPKTPLLGPPLRSPVLLI